MQKQELQKQINNCYVQIDKTLDSITELKKHHNHIEQREKTDRREKNQADVYSFDWSTLGDNKKPCEVSIHRPLFLSW